MGWNAVVVSWQAGWHKEASRSPRACRSHREALLGCYSTRDWTCWLARPPNNPCSAYCTAGSCLLACWLAGWPAGLGHLPSRQGSCRRAHVVIIIVQSPNIIAEGIPMPNSITRRPCALPFVAVLEPRSSCMDDVCCTLPLSP